MALDNTTTPTIDALQTAVADTVVTTMMAQNFHWNVTGMGFGSLHALFQEIYEDHFVAQDDLSERIKALGGHAKGTLASMIATSDIVEHDGNASAEDMVGTLANAQRSISQSLAQLAKIAAEAGDDRTEDLAIARGQVHDKFAWILDAHLR